MNIVAGLGNPGEVFNNTRHNAGLEIVQSLSETLGCPKFSLKKKMQSEVCKLDQNVFVKPQTFMNGSGFSVKAVLDYYLKKSQTNYENLYIIHDDLDIALGDFKIKFASGPVGHNGLMSIYQHLGTKNFWHVRIGIDTREGDRTMSSPVYVLQKFNVNETQKFNSVKMKVIKRLINLIT
ncbi:aminoacyl-tRNA hydrolase [Patescibacteria group bacterium]|nr:aminoacyl-tRNA hydrolase [Patescibacteria group bacterium]